MGMKEAEAIAKIQCDIGVDNVVIRRLSFKNWAILDSQNNVIYEADTEIKCRTLLFKAKEVK